MKTIITLDKADQAYGFPQLDGNGNIKTDVKSVKVSAQMFMNPQIITEAINIPAEHNAFLSGPVGLEGLVTVASGSNLTII